MMRRVSPLLLVGLMALMLAPASQAQEAGGARVPKDKPPTKLTPLMQSKLDKSKLILEGLTMEDFEKIAANARQLRMLSLESGWNVIQTEEYQAQSKDFQRTTDLIAKAAADKDVNRAALGYVALTVRCVECHSYMRQHQANIKSPE